MTPWLDALMVLAVCTSLKLLGSSRLGSSIRTVAVQGAILGLVPVAAHPGGVPARLILLTAAAGGLKAVVFPWLLFRALSGARVRREVEPFVGYTSSLMIGLRQCRLDGCRVFLITVEKLRDENWPREAIDEVFFMPDGYSRDDIIKGVSYLARTQTIDRIVPLDEFDQETAAQLRELGLQLKKDLS